jgi:membrane protein involved in colicin uptake
VDAEHAAAANAPCIDDAFAEITIAASAATMVSGAHVAAFPSISGNISGSQSCNGAVRGGCSP